MKNNVDVITTLDRLPPSLRSELWIALSKAIEDEILNMISVIEEKKTIYDIDNMTYEQLIEISEVLGVPFNATINSSTEFLREEVRAIPFKIQYKDTVIAYDSFYKALSREGQVYAYFYQSGSGDIIRNLNGPLLSLGGHNVTQPLAQLSSGNFTGIAEDVIRLDSGEVLDVENDEGQVWTLDTTDSEITTNHLGVELLIDRIIVKNAADPVTGLYSDREYLMIWEYLDFVQVNMEFSRRVVQVPHVGSNLMPVIDNSGHVNPYDAEFTCPDIKLKAVTNPTAIDNLNSYLEISKIEFGIGGHTDLPVKEGGGTFPSALDIRIAEKTILFDEKWEAGNWYSVIAEYKGQQVNRFPLHDNTGYLLADTFGSGVVDGVNNDFQGELLFTPIKPQNVNFRFIHGTEEYDIIDDGMGLLTSEAASGTIDYSTGRYVFSTDFIYSRDDVQIGVSDGIETSYSTTLSAENQITPGSLELVYTINDRRYVGNDDGAGNITGTGITSGTIDYGTYNISLVFSEAPTLDSEILVSYSHQRIFTPDADTEIEVDFYFTNSIVEITEAGVYDENDNLLAYATFPPIEFSNAKNHLNFGFAINKSTFTSQVLP